MIYYYPRRSRSSTSSSSSSSFPHDVVMGWLFLLLLLLLLLLSLSLSVSSTTSVNNNASTTTVAFFSSSSSSSADDSILLLLDDDNDNDIDDDDDDEYFIPIGVTSEIWRRRRQQQQHYVELLRKETETEESIITKQQQQQQQQHLRLQRPTGGRGLPVDSLQYQQQQPPHPVSLPFPPRNKYNNNNNNNMKDDDDVHGYYVGGDIKCMFLSQERCQQIDDAMIQMKNKISQQQQQQHTTSTTTRLHQVRQNHHLKTLVILIQWQDHAINNKQLIPIDHINRLWNANDINPILYPSGSIKRYLLENSYSNLYINATIVPNYITTNGTEAYYANGRYGFDTSDDDDTTFDRDRPQLRQALYYVLEQMELQGFNFSEFDQNNDLELDSVIFMHTGYDAAYYFDNDCNYPYYNPPQDRIWSHATSDNVWYDDAWVSSSSQGIKLGSYAITSIFRGSCDANIVRVGIVGHEFLHTLGLPDLYDADGPYNNNNHAGGLGSYDIMSNPSGHDYRPKYPGFLSPWSKMELNFVIPIEIDVDGTYLARPSNVYPDIFIIRQNFQDGEYLLIENRQPISFDRRMRGGGILVYHIDTTTSRNGIIRSNGNRGFPSQQNWPQNGNHYPVALLQADGLYYIEQGLRNQAYSDFFHTDQHILRPGGGDGSSSSTNNYPNTDSYVNGYIQSTGIIIDHFEETIEPGTWSFRVTFDNDFSYEPSQRPSQQPTTSPTSIDDICHQILEIKIKTDSSGHETNWELINTTAAGGTIIDGDGEQSIDGQIKFEDLTIYEYRMCLPNLDNIEYTFTIYDSYGDGMCDSRGCRGWWKLWLNGRIINEGRGDDLTYSSSYTFTTMAN